MTPENTLSIYGSHDASVTFIDKFKQLRIYEYERFIKKRYAMYSSAFDDRAGMGSNHEERESFLNLIKKNLYNENIENILYAELNTVDIDYIKTFFPNSTFKNVGHHFAHACSGFYSSGFENAIIFSVDGGGMDNNVVYSTKIFIGDKLTITEEKLISTDYGNPYSAVAYLLSEINPGAEGHECINSLAYAGKIMGLCAYGNIIEEWIEHFHNFYNDNNLQLLCEKLKLPYGFNVINGQTSYDLAATSQYVFEQKMDELIMPYVLKYNTNVVLVGGCALNVLYNQKLFELLQDKELNIYVPPNPNDCGQSYGMYLSEFPEYGKKEMVYSGLEILDFDKITDYISQYNHEDFTYEKIVDYLKEGKIIGIISENSEVGPRALGNRSIICDPSFPEMKDILNSKVKFREWYRPFAPVCRLEDKDLYFINSCESKYMSYAPKVKSEYENQLKSIVHIDKSTRLQTTTSEQHTLFNGILLELKKRKKIPVILNTSFNIKGFPILTTLKDAFSVLDNTELDLIVTNNMIFKKTLK